MTSHACSDAAFLSSVDGIGALPHLHRLLARGEPVDMAELVDVAGDAGAELDRVVRALTGAEWDTEGRLVGFGLTRGRPTSACRSAPRLSVRGAPVTPGCSPSCSASTPLLESICPTTGEQVRLELTAEAVMSVTPPDAVVSQRHRPDQVSNLRADICDHGHFFASPDVATGWLATHPDGQVRSIAEVFTECRAAGKELGWLSPEAST